MTTAYYANKGKNDCSIEGCGRPFRCSGYCRYHYYRFKTYGTPEPNLPRVPPPVRRRPRTETHAYCSGCDAMLPHEKFGPGRTKCRACTTAVAMKARKTCPECQDTKIPQRSERCRDCYANRQRTSGRPPNRTFDGYVRIAGYKGHPNACKRGTIKEHTLVMTQMLGRPLLPGENVHHKNGVRHDNRPENLELWVVSQPSGQRPEDLVAWAREILDRYATDRVA